MKKYLFLLLLTATLNYSYGQKTASLKSTNYSCSISCFFESCWINCKLGGTSYAVCTCWWGFAYCKCKQISGTYTAASDYAYTQTAEQRQRLVAFQGKLSELGYGTLAMLAGNIQQAIDHKEPVGDLVKDFGERADALSPRDRNIIESHINSPGEEPHLDNSNAIDATEDFNGARISRAGGIAFTNTRWN